MKTDDAFFHSLCQISNLAIISKTNSGLTKEQAMLEVAQLIAIYLNAIVITIQGKDETAKDIHPDSILNFIKEQYK